MNKTANNGTFAMRKLISDYSGGKIGIKYYLAKPKYTRTSINLIVLIVTLIILPLIFYVLPKGLENVENNFVLPISVLIVILLLSVFLGPILLKFDRNGKLYFKEDQMVFKYSDGNELVIPYDEILKIEYNGNIRKDLISKSPSYKTIKVRLINFKKEHINFEATNEMFLTTSERNIQRTIDPILPITLEAIKPKYGLVINKKL